MKLELLAPAKNAEYGREAINHGADAVYIGAPAFGARAAATNTIDDIDSLVQYAHLYGCKVFATVNTLLFDDEVEPAVRMIRQLYNAGVDALIIQDMGLLECDLPPIELHASTQCHNASVERVQFLEKVGFKRVILAREVSLSQMRAIRQSTTVDLEAFVHGALCVCYSGQCYLSQYLTGRSGNRGTCAQPCRSRYDLLDADGRLLLKDLHLLTLKDFNASQQLRKMVEAGITSFKIEGRLKDLGYVKNVTAYYRQLLDGVMNDCRPSSSGHTRFFFTPDPERTFNRGYTDYFLRQRQPMANFVTQKSMGKRVGEVVSVSRNSFTVSGSESFTNGDGLCYVDAEGRLQGFLVNEVQGRSIVPNRMPDLRRGTSLWRNNDRQFERLLQGCTAERRLAVDMLFSATGQGATLTMTDEDGLSATSSVTVALPKADKPAQMAALISKQLAKLGGTPFEVRNLNDATEGCYFLSAGALNELRRMAVERLIAERVAHFRPHDVPFAATVSSYPAATVDYRANVVNRQAEQFYRRYGATVAERGLESTGDYAGKSLMTCKYCLRFELGCCLQGKSKGRPQLDLAADQQLLLRNNGRLFRLQFDCAACQMSLVAVDPAADR